MIAIKSANSYADATEFKLAVKNRTDLDGHGVKNLRAGYDYMTTVVGGIGMDEVAYSNKLAALLESISIKPKRIFIENEVKDGNVSALLRQYIAAVQVAKPYGIRVTTSGLIMPLTRNIGAGIKYRQKDQIAFAEAEIGLILTENLDIDFCTHYQLLGAEYFDEYKQIVDTFTKMGLRVVGGELALRDDKPETAIALTKCALLTPDSYIYNQTGLNGNALPLTTVQRGVFGSALR